MRRAIHCARNVCLVTLLTAFLTAGRAGHVASAELQIEEGNAQADRTAASVDQAAPIQIRIGWGVSGPLGDAFMDQANQYNKSQQRIVVEVQELQGYGGVYDLLMNADRADELPDAAIVEIHSIASLAAAKKVVPLDELVRSDPTFRPDDLLAGVLTNLYYRGKLMALPINRSTPVLYYNKDRFAEAGLNPDRPPETWQEVQIMARALASDDGTQYGFLAPSFPWIFESLVWSSGGKLTEGSRATFAESGAKAMQIWANMVHRDASAQYGGRYSATSEFPSGRVAMAIESTAMLQMYSSAARFSVGTAPLPRFAGHSFAVPTGGGAAVIPTRISPERQVAAWAFLSWFINTQQAAKWSRMTGYIPMRDSAQVLLSTEGFYVLHPEFETAITQVKFAREAPQLPRWTKSWPIIADSMTEILRDDAPALETLKEAEAKVTMLLSAKSDE